jgi:hypothetical protein
MDMQVKNLRVSGYKKGCTRWSITFLTKDRLRGYIKMLVDIEVGPTKGTKGNEEFWLGMI